MVSFMYLGNKERERERMKMISGSKFLPAATRKKEEKRKGDVHVVVGETLIVGHGDSHFLTKFMHNCVRVITTREEDDDSLREGFRFHPRLVLNNALTETNIPGSCTACIITLKERILYAVNVGDNGFILMRNEEILYESPVQQHTYKVPYTVGNSNDIPEEIELSEVEVGDIVVSGSAGLFHNLFSHEIKEIVLREIGKNTAPEMIAAEIARTATERSLHTTRFTPYSKAAWRAGKRHKGGKLGDVTAIFSVIIP